MKEESDTIKDNSHSTVSEDDIVVAVTFNNKDEKVVFNGARFCLPSSVPYKLAVSVAKKRFEIEGDCVYWIVRNRIHKYKVSVYNDPHL